MDSDTLWERECNSGSEEEEEKYEDGDEVLSDALQEEEEDEEERGGEGEQVDTEEEEQVEVLQMSGSAFQQYLSIIRSFLSANSDPSSVVNNANENNNTNNPSPITNSPWINPNNNALHANANNILSHRIAQDIVSGTRCFADKPNRSVLKMLTDREMNVKCPYSYQDRVHISHRLIPSYSIERQLYDHQVFCGQFSKDGTVYMSACQDRHIRLYDTQTWRQTKDIVARDIGWSVIDTDYSPDQRWLIYSSWSDFVHFCNIHGEYEIHEALDFRPDSQRFCLFSIKFSPDSNEILGGSSDRHLYIYDLDRKERILKVQAHADDINSVAFLDSSGQTILSGSDDFLVKVWDKRMMGAGEGKKEGMGKGCVGALVGHLHGITHVSSKGDGRYLITNGKDQCIKLWDVRAMISQKEAMDSGKPHGGQWDYRYGGLGQQLRMFDGTIRHPKDLSLMTYRGHRVLQTLIRAYFSPESTTGGKYIYTGSYDGSAFIYDVLSGQIVAQLKGHQAIIRDLSWHPTEPVLVTTSWDRTVREWTPVERKQKNYDDGRETRRRGHHYDEY